MMKITVITGSPHRRGTSALLADEFIRGAGEAGHEVFRFDAAFEKVGPCLGCDKCRDGGACIQKDSMEKLNPVLLESDLVVFVTPLYYFGISAQLKAVIDRFYAENDRLQKSKKKAVLMATAPQNGVRDGKRGVVGGLSLLQRGLSLLQKGLSPFQTVF